MTTRIRVIDHVPRQTTSFLGREDEISSIIHLLENPLCQLLTLIGSGGIGKTRLALAVAERSLPRFADGVTFVELQALRSPADIPAATRDAFSLPMLANATPETQVLEFLGDKTLLLILDNFEHLRDGVDFLARMIAVAPHLKIVVTSRELLRLQAEWVWPVPSLDYPEAITGEQDATSSAAVQLFAARAQQLKPDFDLGAELPAVARICQLVEGIPLALELAAGWVRTLPCTAIAVEIERHLDFLSTEVQDIPERHRSMRAVFSHSWRLLFEEERLVFQQLAVFRGSFDREAAESVAGASLPMLAAFVDKSLLRQTSSGRYDMHELLRQFAEDQLRLAGGLDSAFTHHSRYYLELLAQREADLKGRCQFEVLAAIKAEFENIRAAWIWAVDHAQVNVLNRSLEGLYWFCTLVNWNGQRPLLMRYARDHLTPDADEPSCRLWGRLLARAHEFEADAETQLCRALEIAQQYCDRSEIALCLLNQGHLLKLSHRYTSALEILKSSLHEFLADHNEFMATDCLWSITNTYLQAGQFQRALDFSERGAQMAREMGNFVGLADLLWAQGAILGLLGREVQAQPILLEARQIFEQVGDQFGTAAIGWHLADQELARGHFDQARAYAEELLEVAEIYRDDRYRGRALVTLSHLALIEGDDDTCERLALASLTALGPGEPIGLFAQCGLAQVALSRHDDVLARRLVLPVLQHNVGVKVHCLALAVVAALDIHQKLTIEAAELIGLILAQSPEMVALLLRWPLVSQVREELEALLNPSVYQLALERGAQLDLSQIAIETAARLQNAEHDLRAVFLEPLTPHEQEVLHLMAAGSSNRQIAQALGVTVGTIKTYTHRIYQKLDVESRVQAVSRAHSLHLI